MTDIYSQQRRNRRITVFLMLGFFLFVLAVGFSVDIYTYGTVEFDRLPVATIAAVSFASINAVASYWLGSAFVLRSTGAASLDFGNLSHKKLHNVVTEMAIASGLPMPKVYVIPDPSPNAFATGRNPSNASIAVTQGLLDTMNRDELQAVVAHEMGHIKSYDILTMTVVAVLVGTISLLSDWAVRTWRYGGVRPRRDLKGKGGNPLLLLVIALFVLLSPLLSRIIAMAVSRNREYQADALSAEFTRNPGSLADALEKISTATSPMRTARRGTAHFFICDPLKRRLDDREGFAADLLSTHPPVEKRIERLKKMAYERGAAQHGG